jgi:hypothetical protein
MADSASSAASSDYELSDCEFGSDEAPPEYGSAVGPGSSKPEAGSERKLYSSGYVRVKFSRAERNSKGKPVYNFHSVHIYRRGAVGGSYDPLLTKAKERIIRKLTKKRPRTVTVPSACMHCTGHLAKIGYQVVSVEGAIHNPTDRTHYLTIQFTRPV